MESVLRFFGDIGFSDQESKVYLFLLNTDGKKAREISQVLKIERVQLYRMLNNLQKRGLIECSFGHPAIYSAVPFEEVLNLMIASKKEEAKNLEGRKDELISQLGSYRPENNKADENRFIVLEGRTYLYSKISQMIHSAKKTVNVISSGRGVNEAYHSGLFEEGFYLPQKEKVFFRFLTSFSTVAQHHREAKEVMAQAKQASMNFESRICNFEWGNFLRFVLKDDDELLLFLKNSEITNSMDENDTGLWTTNKVLIQTFSIAFEHIWRNSMHILDKLKQEGF